jgi:hypothetical protein
VHLESVFLEARDLSPADAASGDADDQRVADRRSMHVGDVLETAAGEEDALVVEEVPGEEEDEVHARRLVERRRLGG